MGTVFLGWDELLERRVAIKVLHPSSALSGDAKVRFLREARVLSRLDHPGICTIHDILEHDGRDALILEFVDGVSLRKAIAEGSIPEEDRLAIAEAIAEALAAAHEAGVIHRDLKPENVMLRADGGVAILDFRLARPVGAASEKGAGSTPDPTNVRVTLDGAVVGTPGYISPEQIAGRPADRASDVYALGLLLQELFTGEPAFDLDKPLSELLGDVMAGAVRPCTVPDARLRSLITAMTAKDPADRPDTVRVKETLRQLLHAPERARNRRRLIVAGVALAAISVLVGIVLRRTVLPPPLLEAGSHARVAVLPFTEPPGGAALGIGLAEMIARTLDGHEALTAVPMSRVLKATHGKKGEPSPARWAEIGRRLDSRIVVGGRLLRRKDELELHVEVLDREGGIQRFRVRARTFPEALSLTCGALARRLVPGQTLIDPKARFSPDPLASLAFAGGEQRRYTTGAASALPYFTVCLDRDPSFWAAWFAELDCLDSLGRWKEGEDSAQALLKKARSASDSAREADALGALGLFQLRLGQVEESEKTWKNGLDLVTARGDREQEVTFLNRLGTLYLKTGRSREAWDLFSRAASLARNLGDRTLAAAADVNLGSVARRRGDFETARRHLDQALEVYRSMDSVEDIGLVEYNLGAISLMQGQTDDAERHLQAALQAQEKAGNIRQAAEVREGLAMLAWSRGDLASAEALLREALDAYRNLDHPEGIARASGNLAVVLRDRGRFADAERTATLCLDAVANLHHPGIETSCAGVLAQVLALQGRTRAAAGALTQSGIDHDEVTVIAARGLILYEKGDLANGARLLRKAAEAATGPDHELYARWAERARRGAREGRKVPIVAPQ